MRTHSLGFSRQLFLPTVLAFAMMANVVYSQDDTAPVYKTPPKTLVDLVDAPTTPGVSIDPTGKWMLLMERPSLPSIEELSQPELRIGGMRINPRTNGPSRRSYYTGFKIKSLSGGEEQAINDLPQNARIQNVSWAPDGKTIAFSVTDQSGLTLWVADVKTCDAKRLLDRKLNAAYGSPFKWVSDSRTIICKVTANDRGDLPQESLVPGGPVIQETTGRKAPARTYQDLLKNPHDEKVFAWYLSSQIVKVTLDGATKQISKTALYERAEPSPDGARLLVETIHRPFSYLVPVYRFPYTVEVWDMDGKLVKQIADLPLAENVPIGFGSVPTGPRSFGWRADADATIYWTEAQDDGNVRAEAEIRDIVYTQAAPFDGDPKPLISLGYRYAGIQWAHDGLALVSERWWQTRQVRSWAVQPGKSDGQKTLLVDYSWQDRYNNPGSPTMVADARGQYVLQTDAKGSKLYFTGSGASDEGDRPFIDEFDVKTQKKKRLWRSEPPHYEYPAAIIDAKKMIALTRRETKTEQPNYYLRSIKSGKLTQLTDFPHPAPSLADVQKEIIQFEREDGVKLSGNLYLPPGYKPEDGPLPMLMWAYPREFKSADAASQMRGSPHQFVRVRWSSPVVWLSMGYAVLDDPAMPIIGEGEQESNDTFVEQLVGSAKAAVDEVVRRGVADPEKIAIGGHSYGAFMTANLLAHSDLFAAGIARSGAYNRTLTPFGFQAEQRTFWEAPETYFAMSPFMHAQKVNEPILLIHGAADNNSGTFPMQSERYYHALKGHGAKARLVMLPNESHGYRARESVLHMMWETYNWLETYVKNAKPKKEKEKRTTSMR